MFFISDLFNLIINFKFIYSKNEKNKKNVCLIFLIQDFISLFLKYEKMLYFMRNKR